MDMYQAVAGEDRSLEKSTRKLVDSTSAEADLRAELLAVIEARLNAVEAARDMLIYPQIRTISPMPDLACEYDARIGGIRQSIDTLRRLPADSHEFQRNTEVLHEQTADFTSWEVNDAFPLLRGAIDEETAAEFGDRIRARQKEVFRQELKLS